MHKNDFIHYFYVIKQNEIVTKSTKTETLYVILNETTKIIFKFNINITYFIITDYFTRKKN